MKDAEMIIKALKVFPGETAILYSADTNETITFQDVVDYVQGLQNENERLNDIEFTKEHCNLYEENEWLKRTISGYVADQEVWVSGYRGTQKENEQLKAEIERLTEEKTDWEKSCHLWSGANKSNHLKFTKTLEKLCEERNKNTELQRQVDELKEENRKLFEYGASKIVECEQAVKDKTKEIFEKIFEVLCCFTTQGKSKEYNEGYIDCLAEVDKRLQNLAKERGVEV